jgi:hypothetical protein
MDVVHQEKVQAPMFAMPMLCVSLSTMVIAVNVLMVLVMEKTVQAKVNHD